MQISDEKTEIIWNKLNKGKEKEQQERKWVNGVHIEWEIVQGQVAWL